MLKQLLTFFTLYLHLYPNIYAEKFDNLYFFYL